MMELLEDAGLMHLGYPRAGIGHADVEAPVYRFRLSAKVSRNRYRLVLAASDRRKSGSWAAAWRAGALYA